MCETKPSEDSIQHFIDYTWKDMHHSIVLLAFGILFCLVGYMITLRHQKHLYRQLGWIDRAQTVLETGIFTDKIKFEEYINRIETKNSTSTNKDLKDKSSKWKRWNVGRLIGYFYLLLLILDLCGIIGVIIYEKMTL